MGLACTDLRLDALVWLACAVPVQLDDIEALNYDDLSAVAKLSGSALYKDVIQVRQGSWRACMAHGWLPVLTL